MRGRLLATVMALGLAGSAAAEEYQVGLVGSAEYDSNVFNSTDGQDVEDTIFRVGPVLGLRRSHGDLVYEIQYEPRYEIFLEDSAPDVWDHNLFVRGTWLVGPRTTLQAENRFLITHSLNRAGFIADPSQPDLTPVPQVEIARQKLTRNFTTLSLNHFFTPRVQGNLVFAYQIFDSEREDSFDSSTWTATASGRYTLRIQDQLGGGFRVSQQMFDATTTQNGSVTTSYNLFATWIHQFSPTFTLDAQVGPAFISTEQDGEAQDLTSLVPTYPFRDTTGGGLRTINSSTCPLAIDGQPVIANSCALFPTEITGQVAAQIRQATRVATLFGSEPSTPLRMNVFATISLRKTWEDWRLSIRYTRTDSQSSGVGQATVLDFFSASLIFDPNEDWSVELVASLANRQSATDQFRNSLGLRAPSTMEFTTVAIDPATGQQIFDANGNPVLVPVDVRLSRSANFRNVESDNFTNIQTYTTTLQVRRRITRTANAFVRFLYLNQRSETEFEDRNFDNWRIQFGVRIILDWERVPLL